MPVHESVVSSSDDASQRKRQSGRLVLGFGLFFIFFVYYMGTAIINTPAFKGVATIPVLGMPLGMALSLGVFPVSWIIMAIYILKWR